MDTAGWRHSMAGFVGAPAGALGSSSVTKSGLGPCSPLQGFETGLRSGNRPRRMAWHSRGQRRRTNHPVASADGTKGGELVKMDDGPILDQRAGEFFAELPVRRLLVWLGFAGLLVCLRSFLGLTIATFFIGYIGNSVARTITNRTGDRVPRKAVVAGFYSAIVVLVTAFSLLTIPTVIREGQDFVQTLQSANPYVFVADGIRRTVGDDTAERIESIVVLSMGKDQRPEPKPLTALPTGPPNPVIKEVWTEERSRRLGVLLQKSASGYVSRAATLITRVLGLSTKLAFKALVALVFSFLIIWDLPAIATGVLRLRDSKARAVYLEIAPRVADFCQVLGKSFEAQSMIALINTSLTTFGVLVLRLPGLWFLSLVILACSFIPVVGVFISTLPMLIVALSHFGISKAFQVLLMVLGVHAVEAYVLNPQIYKAHLKLPPLLVLIVLYIAEHMFGIIGLLVAVPAAVFVLRALGVMESQESKAVIE